MVMLLLSIISMVLFSAVIFLEPSMSIPSPFPAIVLFDIVMLDPLTSMALSAVVISVDMFITLYLSRLLFMAGDIITPLVLSLVTISVLFSKVWFVPDTNLTRYPPEGSEFVLNILLCFMTLWLLSIDMPLVVVPDVPEPIDVKLEFTALNVVLGFTSI